MKAKTSIKVLIILLNFSPLAGFIPLEKADVFESGLNHTRF